MLIFEGAYFHGVLLNACNFLVVLAGVVVVLVICMIFWLMRSVYLKLEYM